MASDPVEEHAQKVADVIKREIENGPAGVGVTVIVSISDSPDDPHPVYASVSTEPPERRIQMCEAMIRELREQS